MARPDWIEVGRVKRAHGLQGEVRVLPSTDNPDRFAAGQVVHARLEDGSQVRLEIEGLRGTWDNLILAFGGTETREAAEALRGAVLEVPAEELPELEEGEYYPFDLEGLEVRTSDGGVAGRVSQVLETPANELLAVALSGGGEALVPFTFEAVPEVEIAAGYVVVESRFLLPPEYGGGNGPGA